MKLRTLLCCLAVTVASSRMDGAPLLHTLNYMRFFVSPGLTVCAITTGTRCSGSVLAPDTNWTVNYFSESEAAFGLLRAQASVYLTGDGSLGPLDGGGDVSFPSLASVGGRASFWDAFTISGGSGEGVLNLTFTLTGKSSQTPGQSGRAQIHYIPAVDGALDYSKTFVSLFRGGEATIPIPFTFGTPVEFNIDFYALAQIYSWVPGAAATADFYNTARLTKISVKDSSGSVVPRFSIDADSGTRYGPSGIVPEPSSLAMCALAAVALGGRLWRKRGA